VAIFQADGKVTYNPQSNTVIQKDNKLIVIGEEKNIQQLITMATK
jgi:K+/H+ antiporter YhaU regulatory subunit KhtT